MSLEIPTFTRCCCCFPLRRGIIILGYLSLVFAVFVVKAEIKEITRMTQNRSDDTMTLFRGARFSVQKGIPMLLYCIEIVFIVLLLAGAHTKRPGLMQVYYYYGVTTTAAAPVIFLWTLTSESGREQTYDFDYYFYHLVDLCIIFIGIVTQVYLLLMIRSELRKPREALCSANPLTEVYVQQPTLNNLSFL